MKHRAAVLLLSVCALQAWAVVPLCEPLDTFLEDGMTVALNDCKVSNVLQLYASDVLGEGSPELCSEACGKTLRMLLGAAEPCTAAQVDSVFGFTNALDYIKNVVFEHSQCLAPHPACLGIIRDLERWEQSLAGSQCFSGLAAALTNSNVVAAQASVATICRGDCGVGMQYYLAKLDAAGCTSWGAYREKNVAYGYNCLTAGGEYCAPVFSPLIFRADILQLEDASVAVAVKETLLATMCSTCFHAFVRLYSKYGFSLEDIAALEGYCLKMKTKWCFPHFAAAVNVSSGDGPNSVAVAICGSQPAAMSQNGHDRCGTAMLVRQKDVSALSAQESRDLDHTCLVDSDSTNLCASAVASIVEGYQADKSFQGGLYPVPSKCDVLVANSTCFWGCQRQFIADQTAFGCCYESTRAYFTASGFANVPQTFARPDLIAAECNRAPEPACVLHNHSLGVKAYITVSVPLSFLKRNTTAIRAALVNDIARALGRSPTSFYFAKSTFEFVTAATSNVHFYILGQSASDVAGIVDAFVANRDGNQVWALNTERQFALRCRTETGAACNSAARVWASAAAVFLGLVVALAGPRLV